MMECHQYVTWPHVLSVMSCTLRAFTWYLRNYSCNMLQFMENSSLTIPQVILGKTWKGRKHFLFYRWVNWGSEMLSNFSIMTDRAECQTEVLQILPCFSTTLHCIILGLVVIIAKVYNCSFIFLTNEGKQASWLVFPHCFWFSLCKTKHLSGSSFWQIINTRAVEFLHIIF